MKTLKTIALLACTAVASATMAGEPSRDAVAQVDAAVRVLADAQERVLAKAVAFCATYQPENRSIEATFKAYVAAFSAGTKAGMLEISQTDKDVLRPMPPYTSKDFEMMDRQAATLLSRMQAAPGAECSRFGAALGAETAERFKEQTLQGHQEYKAKRAQYCARVPKPSNCN